MGDPKRPSSHPTPFTLSLMIYTLPRCALLCIFLFSPLHVLGMNAKAKMARIAQLENREETVPKEPVTAPTKDDGLTVSGAGTKEANGVYEQVPETSNGKPLYEKDGHYIQNEKDINGGKSYWVLRSRGLVLRSRGVTDGDILYYVESNADAPPKNGWKTNVSGSPDSPLS